MKRNKLLIAAITIVTLWAGLVVWGFAIMHRQKTELTHLKLENDTLKLKNRVLHQRDSLNMLYIDGMLYGMDEAIRRQHVRDFENARIKANYNE